MRPCRFALPLCFFLASMHVAPVCAQQKLAQTGMKFLSVGADARASAMGDAYTAVEGMASCWMYNPAGASRLANLATVSVGQTQWFADINHYVVCIAMSPSHAEYGVLGAFLQVVDYGAFQGTARAENAKGYVDLGEFTPQAAAIGFAYARALSEKFSVGGDVKYVRQDLGPAATAIASGGGLVMDDNVTDVYAFDFGVEYRTGFKSLTLGMAVRNFSKEAQFKSEGFQLPLVFRIGVAMNVADLFDLAPGIHAVLLSLDAEHPRDYPEQLRVGVEYGLMNTVFLRMGYVGPADEQSLSYGIGLQKGVGTIGVGFNYAYTPFGVLGNVHRFSFQFSL